MSGPPDLSSSRLSRWLYGWARTEESQRRVRIAAKYLFAAILGVLVSECSRSIEAFTLYRTSPVSDERVYIATFAGEGIDYNRGNCRIAAELLQAQPGVTVKFWCEKGLDWSW
jgi:hypothetical protein